MPQASRIFVVAVLTLAAGAILAAQKPQLPAPFLTPSVTNHPRVVPPPVAWSPTVPPGFRISVYADSFLYPRWLAVAPNGDVFAADTTPSGDVVVLHGRLKAESRAVFADQLQQPFGIAFHNNYVYIAETNQVVRYRYDPKTSKRLGQKERVLDIPGGPEHFTRSLAFSPDGQRLMVAIGSGSNYEPPYTPNRAAILTADPDGAHARLYASGLCNAVGIAFNPQSGQLWADGNERDELGDNLPPDYFTTVQDGGFYGWPYSYIGQHVDDRVTPQRPDLVAKAIIPDVLLEAHVAPLQLAFYTALAFPPEYRGGAFIAEHGSWNRRQRDGYRVWFIPFENGKPSGPGSAFFSGFVPDPAQPEVYGRPVGVAVAADGALLVSDDGGNKIWRIAYGD